MKIRFLFPYKKTSLAILYWYRGNEGESVKNRKEEGK